MAPKIKLSAEISSDEFVKPFENGWKREVIYRSLPGCNPKSNNASVYYITPAGERLRSKKQIELHLTESLHINMFTLAKQSIGHANEVIRTALGKGYRLPNQHNQSL